MQELVNRSVLMSRLESALGDLGLRQQLRHHDCPIETEEEKCCDDHPVESSV